MLAHTVNAIRLRVLGLTLAAVVCPGASHGQLLQASLEVGATRISHRDVPRTDAATAALLLRREAARYAVAGAGGVTFAADGRSTAQGLLTASLLARPGGRTRWELGGAFTGFSEGVDVNTGAYLVAREHFVLGPARLWLGVAVGGVEEADFWSPTRTAEAGSSFPFRSARVTAGALVVDTRSEPYLADDGLTTDPVTYTDLSIAGRWSFRQRLDVDARSGFRLVSRGALTTTGRATRPFAAVDATIWATDRIGIVAALGRQLSDLARGTPDTRFASLGIRVSLTRTTSPDPPRHDRRDAPLRPRLLVTSDSAGRPRILVAYGDAPSVELAASFTDWEAVQLTRREDGWVLDRALPSGAHRIVIRVAGGEWFVPGNLASALDDFGGKVGILTVP